MIYGIIGGLKIQHPYGGLLSSSCGGLQHSAASEGPFGPKGDFAGRTNGLTNNMFKGVRWSASKGEHVIIGHWKVI